VYPVFDVEWYGNDLIEKGAAGAARRIAAIKELAKGADGFVNACDYDVEGETIGFNILRYACGGKEDGALRAKFSTLTKEDLVKAFGALERQRGRGMAEAGRARHMIDFAWGVNLTRALSQSALASSQRYRTVSVGRVQGPTLGFVVDREREIRIFVPRPYWNLMCVFETDGKRIVASHPGGRLDRKADAEKIRAECAGGTGVVGRLRRTWAQVPPPPPFSIGDLQREAYRAFHYLPSRTLQIAERLYLRALISYPRTGSQKLPASIGYGRILQGLASASEYSKQVAALLSGRLRPVQGMKEDPAHPAIHPTGERPVGSLDVAEAHIYDLVVRRFLSAFAPPARRENVSAEISVRGHIFGIEGGRTVELGWLGYYAPYGSMNDVEFPPMREGDGLAVVRVESEEKFEAPPRRYNQSGLLEKMEREGIGTKATRADIIATLVTRGYMSGEDLTASDLGFSVFEILRRHAPSVVSTELTRMMEAGLEEVEGGVGDSKELVRDAVRTISDQLANVELSQDEVGRALSSAVATNSTVKYALGPCLICKTGKLHVVKSRKSGKRFVGCTNYSSGCRASAPLPQRGTLRAAATPCRFCSWPVVYITAGRFPWKLCVNPDCPSKKVKRREVHTVR
jgi:DNA topoisomerase-1